VFSENRVGPTQTSHGVSLRRPSTAGNVPTAYPTLHLFCKIASTRCVVLPVSRFSHQFVFVSCRCSLHDSSITIPRPPAKLRFRATCWHTLTMHSPSGLARLVESASPASRLDHPLRRCLSPIVAAYVFGKLPTFLKAGHSPFARWRFSLAASARLSLPHLCLIR